MPSPNILSPIAGEIPAFGSNAAQTTGNGGELPNATQTGVMSQMAPAFSAQPNITTSSGVDNSGAFMAGHSQIQNQGSSPWNVLFEPVNHDPFNQQAMPLATSGGMYKP